MVTLNDRWHYNTVLGKFQVSQEGQDYPDV